MEDLPLGELERQRRRACLPLRGERARRLAVDVDEQIVLVCAGETLAAVELGAAVLLLMVAQGVVDLLFRAEGVGHGADRAVGKGQFVAPAGKVSMDGRSRDVQPRGVGRAVADESGRDPAHLVGKIVERVEQRRFFVPVAQDRGFLVI